MEEKKTESEKVVCVDCGDIVDKYDTREYGRGLLCDNCYSDHYITCENCGDIAHQDESYYSRGEYLCRSCQRDREDEEFTSRPYIDANSKDFQSSTLGAIVRSTRIYSAEIECYSQRSAAISNELDSRIGITEDGSLSENGIEIQTPKLKGKRGEDTIHTICKVLAQHDASVDSSTGLHIHIDGKGLFPRTIAKDEPKALKQLWCFYLAIEPVLHSMLPERRRINRYCKPLIPVTLFESVAEARTQRDIERLWYKAERVQDLEYHKAHHYNDTRYHGVNLHCLLAEKHLEIRYHSGTINPYKILHWVNLHTAILDKAAAKCLDIEASRQAQGLTLADRTLFMFNALGLDDKTRKYLLARQAKFTVEKANDESSLLAVASTN